MGRDIWKVEKAAPGWEKDAETLCQEMNAWEQEQRGKKDMFLNEGSLKGNLLRFICYFLGHKPGGRDRCSNEICKRCKKYMSDDIFC